MKTGLWNTLTVAVVVTLVFFVLLYLPLSSPPGIFNTPDENANYFFSKTFAERGTLSMPEPLEFAVDNVIHPRGVNVVQGFLVPESFLGLPVLYGGLAKLIAYFSKCATGDGVWLAPACDLPFISALLSIIALFCLLGIFKFFFDSKIAKLALLFVLANPVFLYWSGRPFMHNVLFLNLAIISWWILLTTAKKNNSRWDMVAGLILGTAIAVRPAEIVWISASTLAIIVISGFCYTAEGSLSRLRRILAFGRRCIKTGFGVLIILVSLLFLNSELYGNFFGSGYSTTEGTFISAQTAVPQWSRVSLMGQLFFPFGFHPIQALRRFSDYGLGGLWWYVALILLGVMVYMASLWKSKDRHNIKPKSLSYTLVWLVVSIYLIVFYGAFNAEIFADPRHPLASSIGTPYPRYWLPIFVFGAPLAAYFLQWLWSRIKSVYGIWGRATCASILILMTAMSLRIVFWQGAESWLAIKDNLFQFAETRERIERTTSEKAIFLIPRFADRIYFPSRRVIVDVEGKELGSIINTLVGQDYPVFWVRGRGEITLDKSDFKALGLRLVRRFDIDPKGKIYQLER